MSFRMDRVHLWACEVADVPGGVAAKLAALAAVGANLDYVDTRREGAAPGHGTLLVAPIGGLEQVKAAQAAGMGEVFTPVVMRIEGDNVAGLAHRLKVAWATAGINLHGSILAALGAKFIGYVTFDSAEDANRAAAILAEQGLKSA